MTKNTFTFKLERPKTIESKKDLEILNDMLKEISSEIIVDEGESESLNYYITIKSESEKIKLLELLGKEK
jgi:hypothetical protein